jgi:hypothetical protein
MKVCFLVDAISQITEKSNGDLSIFVALIYIVWTLLHKRNVVQGSSIHRMNYDYYLYVQDFFV